MTDKDNVLGDMYVEPDPVEGATGIRTDSVLTHEEVESIIYDLGEHAAEYHHVTSARTKGALKKLEDSLPARSNQLAKERAQFLEAYRYVIERDHARNEVEKLKREVAALRARLKPEPEPDDEPHPKPTLGSLLGQLIGSLLREDADRLWDVIHAPTDRYDELSCTNESRRS